MAAPSAKVPSYRVIEGWEKIPAGYKHGDVDGVAIDSQDRVYILTRRDARLMVYEPDGTFVQSFGEGLFTERTHGLALDEKGFLYTADDGDHTVRKFSPQGELLMTLGTPGVPSDTGYDGRMTSTIQRMGPPFNRPTKAAVAPNGDIYVSDGYGNARVHRFSASGQLVQSWGGPGTGPSEFNVVHSLYVADNRVFVCDRENDRVQVFSLDGNYLEEWSIQRPTDIYIDKQGLVYVSSLWWPAGSKDLVGRPRKYDLPGKVSVLDLSGNLLVTWASADRCAAGNFVAPHCVCTDSKGDLYVGEVTWTFGVNRGAVPDGTHTFQKFARQ